MRILRAGYGMLRPVSGICLGITVEKQWNVVKKNLVRANRIHEHSAERTSLCASLSILAAFP